MGSPDGTKNCGPAGSLPNVIVCGSTIPGTAQLTDCPTRTTTVPLRKRISET
ncbi:MAG: hypothetical protein JWQ93_394, partial [Marmoricola sp.]|nr:hypothetical protein [Marmoricola sp.]